MLAHKSHTIIKFIDSIFVDMCKFNMEFNNRRKSNCKLSIASNTQMRIARRLMRYVTNLFGVVSCFNTKCGRQMNLRCLKMLDSSKSSLKIDNFLLSFAFSQHFIWLLEYRKVRCSFKLRSFFQHFYSLRHC